MQFQGLPTTRSFIQETPRANLIRVLSVDILMSSPKAARAAPSSPQSPPPAHSSNSPGTATAPATSPAALIDTATQEQGQDAAIEADVSFAKPNADIPVLMFCEQNDSSGDADSALGLRCVRH